MNRTIAIHVETADLVAVINELKTLEFPREIIDRLVRFLDAPLEAGVLQLDSRAASGAGELVVRFKPGDRLLRFLAAARAGDFDLAMVEMSGHECAPVVGGVAASTIGDSVPGVASGADDNGGRP